ncbi:GNAT family N-acetyltransferase [Actibacterium sp. 188UL27-1]|uniref:GNAT family N-acetyltransferase n=1 Tax=Actibacterium sp. 188UL27-1 TaxID=2786961 RepID=UPI00195E5603|nr:GNAT family N-acetyltransferase [Actibacterium sp. 188UL27-1]MBM7067399.1 GNAT family N-acetyltransferase [Actibacterium sp. 188UL27-1]
MAKHYILRKAVPADADVVVDILRGWIDETPWMPMLHDRADMIRFWRNRLSEAEGTCAMWDDTVCGFSVLDGETLTALYLAPDHRGAGLGAMLMDRAKAKVPRLSLWVFQANMGAVTFYTRHGFRDVARSAGDNEEGLPDLNLVWHLQS